MLIDAKASADAIAQALAVQKKADEAVTTLQTGTKPIYIAVGIAAAGIIALML